VSASGKTILIVEDNAMNLELATDLLSLAGHTIRQAATAEEGIRLAAEQVPDLILMDLRLPGMDGFAALRHLRANPRTAHVPTIALTAQAMQGDREAVRDAGFNGYISKPIDVAGFTAAVAGWLNGRASRP
jgi:CheY-like chemotaxis protein